jgi:hypothetical protein
VSAGHERVKYSSICKTVSEIMEASSAILVEAIASHKSGVGTSSREKRILERLVRVLERIAST